MNTPVSYADFISYKEWVSQEMRDTKQDVKKNTEHRLKSEGRRENSIYPVDQFVQEYINGVTFKRNKLTNQLFYEVSGSRIKVHFSESKQLYYYIDPNDGVSKWCQ